jgi:hypothetical protein
MAARVEHQHLAAALGGDRRAARSAGQERHLDEEVAGLQAREHDEARAARSCPTRDPGPCRARARTASRRVALVHQHLAVVEHLRRAGVGEALAGLARQLAKSGRSSKRSVFGAVSSPPPRARSLALSCISDLVRVGNGTAMPWRWS